MLSHAVGQLHLLSVVGGKGNHFEGGLRVPAIAWWPGTLAPGQVSTQVVSTMDVYPTLVHLAGGQMPTDRHIDGHAIPAIIGQNLRENKSQQRGGFQNETETETERGVLFFYCNAQLMAVRYMQYKFHYRTKRLYSQRELNDNCEGGVPKQNRMDRIGCSNLMTHDPPLVYDVEVDPGEEYPLSLERLSDLLGEASSLIREHRRTLGNLREPMLHWQNRHRTLIPCCNPPYCMCNYSKPLNKLAK